MSVIELTGEAMELAEEAARRNRLLDALFRTGTLIGIGATFYLGWWLYDFFTNANLSMRNAMGSVAELDFPPVHPYLATKQCADELWIIWGGEGEPKTASDWLFGSKGTIDIAMQMRVRGGAEETPSYKLQKFKELQKKIDPDTGAFHGYTGEYYWAKQIEKELISAGSINRVDVTEMHPVDSVANFVLRDKWYWGGVMAVSSLPLISVLSSELEELRKIGK